MAVKHHAPSRRAGQTPVSARNIALTARCGSMMRTFMESRRQSQLNKTATDESAEARAEAGADASRRGLLPRKIAPTHVGGYAISGSRLATHSLPTVLLKP